MAHRTVSRVEAEDEFAFIDSDEELEAYLEQVAPHIGWIVVYFNSLEDHIGDFIRQLILRDPYQDERLEVFLSDMMYAAKSRALLHLYGQVIADTSVKVTLEELRELEQLLNECAIRRNEYAHADWIGVRKEGFLRVKSQSKKTGVAHRYKRVDLEQLKEDVAFIRAARHTLVDFDDVIQGQLWERDR